MVREENIATYTDAFCVLIYKILKLDHIKFLPINYTKLSVVPKPTYYTVSSVACELINFGSWYLDHTVAPATSHTIAITYTITVDVYNTVMYYICTSEYVLYWLLGLTQKHLPRHKLLPVVGHEEVHHDGRDKPNEGNQGVCQLQNNSYNGNTQENHNSMQCKTQRVEVADHSWSPV